MFLEPTTLTSAALVMTETVEQQYGIETKPLLEKLGLDPALMDKPGARYPTAKMRELWSSLAQATGDPCVGLTIGARVKTTSFHALGFAWLACWLAVGLLDGLRSWGQRVRVSQPACNLWLLVVALLGPGATLCHRVAPLIV